MSEEDAFFNRLIDDAEFLDSGLSESDGRMLSSAVAQGLVTRFEKTRSLEDVNRAVNIMEPIVETVPGDDINHVTFFGT